MIDLTDKRTFTRSNGTVFATIYERLTKASRRREIRAIEDDFEWVSPADAETSYRRGVKDAMEAVRKELDV